MLDILIVDDDIESFKPGLTQALRENRLHFANSGKAALETLSKSPIQVVLLDIRMPTDFADSQEREGVEVLKRIKHEYPSLPVIMLTVLNEVDLVIETIKEGAFHYLLKPLDRDKLRKTVESAAESGTLRRKVERMSRQRDVALQLRTGTWKHRDGFCGMIGSHPLMTAMYGEIERLGAFPDMNVVVLGERGTGKEMVARAVHDTSGRKGEFVVVNCAGLAESVLDSELFGHEMGAFTGASTARQGKFRAANGGTLFLDEIGDMPPALQAKVLRAIEYGEVTPVGSDRTEHVDVRIVCATNKNLASLRDAGKFREDLYDRIWDVPLSLPALRDRKSDIPALAANYLNECIERTRVDCRMESDAIAALQSYGWPGNVRELSSRIRQAVFKQSSGMITAKLICELLGLSYEGAATLLPSGTDEFGTTESKNEPEMNEMGSLPEVEDLAEFQRLYGERHLKHVMEEAVRQGGGVLAAMAILGYPQDRYDAFRKKLQRLGVKVRELKEE